MKSDYKCNRKMELVDAKYAGAGKASFTFCRDVFVDIPCPCYKGCMERINVGQFRDLGNGIDECPHCNIGVTRKRSGWVFTGEIIDHVLTSRSCLNAQGINTIKVTAKKSMSKDAAHAFSNPEHMFKKRRFER